MVEFAEKYKSEITGNIFATEKEVLVDDCIQSIRRSYLQEKHHYFDKVINDMKTDRELRDKIKFIIDNTDPKPSLFDRFLMYFQLP